ncbi:MAG: acyl-CoA dehydrogenase family protein [Planctomycetota bacterium]|nr:acyl-CoA dehydrogenase family protein [Planctomycetota bacterium]
MSDDMRPFLESEQIALQKKVRRWVDSQLIARGVDEPEDPEAAARRLLRLLARAGWIGYTIPKRYGGKDTRISARHLCILREEISRGSSMADTMLAVQGLGSFPIIHAGNPEQKKEFLPPAARGDQIAAFALTEPEAGSDIASLQCRAVRRGSAYILNGLKSFISNAGIADNYVVFATTRPAAGKSGITAFIVDADNPGLSVREKLSLIAPHPIGTIEFRDCRVSVTRRLGRVGQGLEIAHATLQVFRPTVGAAAVGLAQRALEAAVDFGSSRRQFGRAILDFQGNRFRLAEMATELRAARLLVHDAAWRIDHPGKDSALASSMAKLFATETAQRVIDWSLQIHGGRGLVSGSVVERLYREIRALRIYEGTSEIQRLIIARLLTQGSRGHPKGKSRPARS